MKRIIASIMILTIVLASLIGCTSDTTNETKEETPELETDISQEEVDFPTGKINLIVPWSAGGITDRVARVFAPLFEKNLGQAVTVVNKEGASGAIGTQFAYELPADGYTVLFSAETPGVFQVMGTSDLSFENFEALKMVIQDTKVIVVPKDSKYNSFEDLVEDIKANPGKIKMSYSGPGASGHIQGLLFQDLGLDISMTPYGGGSPAMIATISGEVDFTFGNYGTVKDYLEVGDLKALAVFGDEEFESLPDVPPMTDELPDAKQYLPLYFPNTLLVKEGTDEEVKQVLIDAATAAFAEPEWQKFVEDQSYTALDHLSPEEIDEYWNKYTSITSYLLYDAGAAENNPEDFGIERFQE